MEKKEYKMRLLVMGDVHCTGIWELNPPDFPDAPHIVAEFEDLHLPQELADKFTAWVESYWLSIDNPKAFDLAEFNKTGRQLAKDLKAFLGNEYYVEFEAEAPPKKR